jgi:hypothetical protein
MSRAGNSQVGGVVTDAMLRHNRIHNSVGHHCTCAGPEVERLRKALHDLYTAAKGLVDPDSEAVRFEHGSCADDPTECDLAAMVQAKRVLDE